MTVSSRSCCSRKAPTCSRTTKDKALRRGIPLYLRAYPKQMRPTLFNQKANKLYRGDCLSILERLDAESVDLVYIDPPFFSNQYYELIWKDRGDRFAFEDRWKGGIQHYTEWMLERITKLFDVLKPTGSIVVHLDWHAVHNVKVEMDKLPVGKFRNEIIWHYTNKLGTGGNVLDRQHDTMLWYTKSQDGSHLFNALY